MWPRDGNELTCLRRPWEGGGFPKETGGAEVRVREMDGRQGRIKELRREARAVRPCVRVLPAFEGLEQDSVGGLIPDGGEERGSCDGGLRCTNISVDLRWVQTVAGDHGEHLGCWARTYLGGRHVPSGQGPLHTSCCFLFEPATEFWRLNVDRIQAPMRGHFSPSDGRCWKSDTSSCAQGVGSGGFGATGWGWGASWYRLTGRPSGNSY